MLRVTTIHASSAGDSARYYTRYLADDSPDGEGRWLGQQADGLGLSAVVSTEDLEALLSGHDPTTGRVLGTALHDRADARGRLIRAVSGFDATFSAPKSVSILWALTGDDGWADAHDVAVRAVLDHLERYGSTTRIRTKAGRQFPDSQGLIMAAFPQATSREDDPQLHSHVVISTKVQTDGGWYALDARYLKRKQRALGGLYQSVLRAELSHRYGITWGPIENGQAEIAGVPEELLAAFSKRSAQVDAALAAKVEHFRSREGRDPTRWERAAFTREAAEDTRAAKTGADAGDLAVRWRDEAAALGWTGERLLGSVAATARTRQQRQTTTVSEVIDHVSAAASTWTRADVLQAVCDLAPPPATVCGGDWARTLERAADEILSHCTSLDPKRASPGTRASDGRSIWIAPIEPGHTSEAVVAQEERILAFGLDANLEPERPSATVNTAGLDVLQIGAARAVAGHDRLVLVVGPAGAGKTAMLRAAVDDLDEQGRAVFSVAPTAKAANVLRRETGAHADTIAKLVFEWARKGEPTERYRLAPGTTVICDEAGMAGTATLDCLIRLAKAQRWRLVLVGDPHQLHAVGRGGMFDELCRSGRAHELATIHRFHHAWERDASLALRAGRPEAIDAYLNHHRVRSGTFGELANQAARWWIELDDAGKRVAVVAETNEHVDALNGAIQAERRRLGHVGDRWTRVAAGEEVAVGDVVVTRRNDRSLLPTTGEPVRNRDRWTVTDIGRDGSITVSHHDGHGTVTLPPEYVREHVRLGYAGTAHSCQGDTVDGSLAVITAATTHRSLYVAATRGREENQLLVVTETELDVRDVLEQVLTNDRADTPAVTQRRELARQAPRLVTSTAELALTEAHAAYREARERAAPHLDAEAGAEKELREAQIALRRAEAEAARAPLWRRRAAKDAVSAANREAARAAERHARAEAGAVPYKAEISGAEERLRVAESAAATERVRQRLEHLSWKEPSRTPTRRRELGVGLEL